MKKLTNADFLRMLDKIEDKLQDLEVDPLVLCAECQLEDPEIYGLWKLEAELRKMKDLVYADIKADEAAAALQIKLFNQEAVG